MILLTLLLLALIAVALFILTTIGLVGTGIAFALADAIVCVLVVIGIIKLIVRK